MTDTEASPQPNPAAEKPDAPRPPRPAGVPARVSRRGFLRRGAAGLCAAGAAGAFYSWRIEPTWLRVRRVTVPVAGLAGAFDGFVIAHVSDLHHSAPVPTDYLRDAVALTNELKPDLIALTGDYITRGDDWVEGVGEIVSAFRAPAGVMAVLGNHDYEAYGPSSAHRRWDDGIAAHMTEAFARGGVEMLRDRATDVVRGGAKLQIAGVDDFWARSVPMPTVMRRFRFDRPTVTLCHNPDGVDLLAAAGSDLVLAGHTHGGQVNIPFFGAPYLPTRNKSLVYGLYEFGRTRLYVNPGVGFLAHRRFNARPEITLITLAAV